MSDRLYMSSNNGTMQILSNNEFPEELEKELIKQGANIDIDGNFDEFEIKDLNSIIKIIEDYVIKNKEIYDLSGFKNINDRLTENAIDIIENSYLFETYNILKTFKEDIKRTYTDFDFKNVSYIIKKGHKIFMSRH